MLKALTAIFLCQLAGETLVLASGLPFPGPVVGMAILFLVFVLRGGIPETVGEVADGFLQHLSLLFVPAGVGIMQHTGRLGSQGAQFGATIVASTLVTIAVTGLVMKLFSPRAEAKEGDHD